ncbi:hypothetical protein PMAYCL1PPCAC_06175, partial [Pristionchus mayeri]
FLSILDVICTVLLNPMTVVESISHSSNYLQMSFIGLSLPSNKGKHPMAAYRLPNDPDNMLTFRCKEAIDPETTAPESRRFKYTCTSCERSKEQGTKCVIRVFFPNSETCEFLSDPADKDRHKCDWTQDEKCKSANVLSSKLAKMLPLENAKSADNGHVKKPGRVQKEANAAIANRLGNLQDIVKKEEVQDVLDLYSGGDNKIKRKKQISRDIKRSWSMQSKEVSKHYLLMATSHSLPLLLCPRNWHSSCTQFVSVPVEPVSFSWQLCSLPRLPRSTLSCCRAWPISSKS